VEFCKEKTQRTHTKGKTYRGKALVEGRRQSGTFKREEKAPVLPTDLFPPVQST